MPMKTEISGQEFAVKVPWAEAPLLQVKTQSDVFVPTDTSLLLIEAGRKLERPLGKTLDLGCGCGVTGLALAQLQSCALPLYASDISAAAVALTVENAGNQGVACVARVGSLFEPWGGERFDCIVDDVSGISDEIARISPWFPSGVSCRAGRDGASWTVSVLEQASKYLTPGGVLVFPILSLSDEKKIMKIAQERFAEVELLLERQWVLPDSIASKTAVLSELIGDGMISCVKKFGKIIWWTRVFAARNVAATE